MSLTYIFAYLAVGILVGFLARGALSMVLGSILLSALCLLGLFCVSPLVPHEWSREGLLATAYVFYTLYVVSCFPFTLITALLIFFLRTQRQALIESKVATVASAWLITAGVLWALSLMWMYLTLAGIAEPVSPLVTPLSYLGLILIGPVALIAGPLFVLCSSRIKLGTGLILLACVILTASIGNEMRGLFHPRGPLESPIPYLFYATMATIVLLSDLAAFALCKTALRTR